MPFVQIVLVQRCPLFTQHKSPVKSQQHFPHCVHQALPQWRQPKQLQRRIRRELAFKEISAQGKDRTQQSCTDPQPREGRHLPCFSTTAQAGGAGNLLSAPSASPPALLGSSAMNSQPSRAQGGSRGAGCAGSQPAPRCFSRPMEQRECSENVTPAHPAALLLLHNLPRAAWMVWLFLNLSSGIIQSE